MSNNQLPYVDSLELVGLAMLYLVIFAIIGTAVEAAIGNTAVALGIAAIVAGLAQLYAMRYIKHIDEERNVISADQP